MHVSKIVEKNILLLSVLTAFSSFVFAQESETVHVAVRALEHQKMQIFLGKKKRPHTKKTNHFAFKEILTCGECDGSITCEEKWQIICPTCKEKFTKGIRSNNCPRCMTPIDEMVNPKILCYVYYHCTKRVHKNCTQGSIELKRLTKIVDKELSNYEISPRFKDWAIEHLNELNKDETTDREVVRGNLKVAYDDCVKKLDNLIQLKIMPQNIDGSVLSDEEFAALAERAENENLKSKEIKMSIKNSLYIFKVVSATFFYF